MTINNNETPDVSRLNLDSTSLAKTQGTSRASSVFGSTSAPNVSQDDSISLSNSPDLVEQALASSDSSRAARIQELKALIAGNQYSPDAQEVSRALIEAHLNGA